MTGHSAERDAPDLPRAGETWKWGWVWADIIKAGPKRVTYYNGEARVSSPTDQFLSRFHRTNIGTARVLPSAELGADHG